MWILLRVAIVLIAVLDRIFGFRFKRLEFQTLQNGLEASITKKQKNNGAVIHVRTQQKIFFRLVPENVFLRTCKKLGLGQELQLGDPSFDDHFYIAADHPSFVQKLKSTPEFIAVIKKLGSLGFQRIENKGDGLLTFTTINTIDTIAPELLSDLILVKQQYESINLSWGDTDPFDGAILLLELFVLAMSAFSFGAIAESYFGGDTQTLHYWKLLQVGLALGVVAVMLWFALYVLLLRKSSRAPLMLFESLVGLILSLGIGLPRLVLDLNMALDSSTPKIILAGIDKKYSKTSGSGRSRRTHYYLDINPNPNSYIARERITLTWWSYNRFTEGQGIALTVRDGFFNAAYIQEMNPEVYPSVLQKNSSTDNSWDDSSGASIDSKLLSLALWKATPTGSSIESPVNKQEKYGNGQLRQIEPYVNGIKQGVAKYWHQNGKIYSEIPWKDNEKHGRFKLYREDGTLEQALSYKNGSPHGLLRWFDVSGKQTHIALYDEGKVIKVNPKLLSEIIKKNPAEF